MIASLLLLQMNHLNWFPVSACHSDFGERQGFETLRANVAISQDCEPWHTLAQESSLQFCSLSPICQEGGQKGSLLKTGDPVLVRLESELERDTEMKEKAIELYL